MDNSGSGSAMVGMSLKVYRSSYRLDRPHGHLLMASLSVKEVGEYCVVEGNLDSGVGLAESIRLAEGSFVRENHAADIRHGKAIVVATSYEWVIYFLLDGDNENIFSN